MSARAGGLALLGLLAVLSSPAAHAQAARDTTSAAARDTTRRGNGTVPADSLPSDDARAVLKSIPEPLAPDEQVEPADSLLRESERAAAPDTSATDTLGVPTPAETAPLGERPGAARSVFADSLGAGSPGAGTGASPGTAAPGATTRPAAADTCWRLQLAAPAEREEAEAKRAAAESQLLVGVAIEVEQGRHKVRSRDCLTRAAADALKARALLSGFKDAFLLRMGADGKAISLSPPKPAAAKKPATAKKPAPAKRTTSGSRR